MQEPLAKEDTVIVSVEHGRKEQYSDAMTAWIERSASNNSDHRLMRICSRELQNFDGYHRNISIVGCF